VVARHIVAGLHHHSKQQINIYRRNGNYVETGTGRVFEARTRVGQIRIITCKQNKNKNIDLFSETETVTFQRNLAGLRYACASGPEAYGCRSGRSLMVASVTTTEHPVPHPHYCITFFRPDAPFGGRTGDSLRVQGLDHMEDVVERSISVSGWCPWREQPRVDGRYPAEMTLIVE